MTNALLLSFVFGSIYSLVLLTLGLLLGYFYGAKEDKIALRRAQFKMLRNRIRNRNESSGTVKPKVITNAEAEAADREPFLARFKQLGGEEPRSGDFLEP